MVMNLTLVRQRKGGGRQIGSIRRQEDRIQLQGSSFPFFSFDSGRCERPSGVLMSSERFRKPDVIPKA